MAKGSRQWHPIRSLEARTAEDFKARRLVKIANYALGLFISALLTSGTFGIFAALSGEAAVAVGGAFAAAIGFVAALPAVIGIPLGLRSAFNSAEELRLQPKGNGITSPEYIERSYRELTFHRIYLKLYEDHLADLKQILDGALGSGKWSRRESEIKASIAAEKRQIATLGTVLERHNLEKEREHSVVVRLDAIGSLEAKIGLLETEKSIIKGFNDDMNELASQFPDENMQDMIGLKDERLEHRSQKRQAEIDEVKRVIEALQGTSAEDVPSHLFLGFVGLGGQGLALRYYNIWEQRTELWKLLREETGEQLGRFIREGTVAAKINHDGVARFYRFGEEHIGDPRLALAPALEQLVTDVAAQAKLGMRSFDVQAFQKKFRDFKAGNLTLLYSVSRFVRGEGLDEEIQGMKTRNAKYPLWQVFEYAWQILAALECIHKGMVSQRAFTENDNLLKGRAIWLSLTRAGLLREYTTSKGVVNAIIELTINGEEGTKQTILKAVFDYSGVTLDGTEQKIVYGILKGAPRGIIHRDLKPENVMIETGGEGAPGWITLIDLGILKFDKEMLGGTQEHETLTQQVVFLGSLLYAAPEQFFGSQGLTTSLDIYTWAVIFYEMLTNKKMFQKSTNLLEAMNERNDYNTIWSKFCVAFEQRINDPGEPIVDTDYKSQLEKLRNTLYASFNKRVIDRPTINQLKAVLGPLREAAARKAGRLSADSSPPPPPSSETLIETEV